jgi:hypothetical protein
MTTRGFLGVYSRRSPPSRFPWYVRIVLPSGEQEYFGSFKTEREAAEAYDRAALHYFGKAALRNFPGMQPSPAAAATLRGELRLRRKAGTSSKFFGVTLRRARWCAAISVGQQPVFLGNWKTERQAAEAYDRAVRFFGADRARLNFPTRRLGATAPSELRKLAYASFKTTTGSRYRGVLFRPPGARRPWIASVRGIGPTGTLHLGTWEVEEDAARAYDRASAFYFGSNAKLNFPGEKLKPADAETLKGEAQRAAKRGHSSQYVGVSWSKQASRWVSVINHQRRHITIGFYRDERAAAEAYDDKCAEFHGPRARLNFDPETGRPVWGARLGELTAERRRRPPR